MLKSVIRTFIEGFPGDTVVKNLPANARDAGLIPGARRSPGVEMSTHSSVPAWKSPWTEEPGGLQLMRPQKLRHD